MSMARDVARAEELTDMPLAELRDCIVVEALANANAEHVQCVSCCRCLAVECMPVPPVYCTGVLHHYLHRTRGGDRAR